MNYKSLRIPHELSLFNHLWDKFQGDQISKIRAYIEDDSNEGINLNQILEGSYFKVTESVAPRVYKSFQETVRILEFSEPIDLFIASNPSINAFTIPSLKKDKPHIIVINSGLLEKFSHKELKFTIGHELGHIIFGSSLLKDHVAFVFGRDKRMHLNFELKLSLWNKLAELSADRIGLIVTNDINSCIHAFFKLSSGIFPEAIDLKVEEYVKQIDEIFNNYKKKFAANSSYDSHPLIPIRIKMLDAFYSSLTYQAYNKQEQIEDKQLQQTSLEILSLLFKYGDSGLDLHRKIFITCAGLLLAQMDEQISDQEMKYIMEALTGFDISPQEFIPNLTNVQDFDPVSFFSGSIKAILNQNPLERAQLFNYMCSLSFADNKINDKEVEFIVNTGQNLLGYSKKEIYKMISYNISREFFPSPWSGM